MAEPPSNGDLSSSGSNMYKYGTATGHGYPTFVYKEEEDCDTGVNPVLALGTIGLLLGSAFFIITRVTNPGGRKRRRSGGDNTPEQEFGFFVASALNKG